MKTKRCARCGEMKEIDNFNRASSASDGLQSYCKKCKCELRIVYRSNNINKVTDCIRKYRSKNADALREKRMERYWEDPVKSRLNAKRWRKNQLLRVIIGYGGKCVKCGESRPGALLLHHPNEDGGKDLKGSKLYKQLIDEGFPDRVVLLCGTCHLIEHRGWED